MRELFVGLMIGISLTSLTYGLLIPKLTIPYRMGVEEVRKEAFEKGYMVKEITDDDKVIYKWK